MDITKVREIREEMERAEARKLQPHFIASFFIEAFKLLGGTLHEREAKRYEVKHVPAVIRNRDREIGHGSPILPRYERITFEKSLISVAGKPMAAFVCPGHPLLDATLDLIIERLPRFAQTRGDPDRRHRRRRPTACTSVSWNTRSRMPAPTAPAIAASCPSGCNSSKSIATARRPMPARPLISTIVRRPTPRRQPCKALRHPIGFADDLESQAMEYAAIHLVPQHLDELRHRKEEILDKTKAAVQDRLTKEINYWDHRAAHAQGPRTGGQGQRQAEFRLGAATCRRTVRPPAKAAQRIGAGTKTLRHFRPWCSAAR